MSSLHYPPASPVHHPKPKRPLVTVVIPTHNRASMIGGAVESVLRQDGCGTLFDLEVIVVDDASTDTTPDVMRRYPTVQYIRLSTNRRASAARNVGIQAGSGQYVAFLDDDDLWLPHRLRVQVPILEHEPTVGVIYGQGVAVNEEGQSTIWPSDGPSGSLFETFLTMPEDIHNIDTWLVRRTLFDKAGLFDETLTTLEHNDMAIRLAFHAEWKFVAGPVCYGRLLNHGLWVTTVRNGSVRTSLRRVVNRALALLSREDQARVKPEAEAASAAMIADQLWHYGGVTAVKDHLQAALRESPRLVEAPSVRERLFRVARETAVTSSAPLTALRALCKKWTDGVHCREVSPRIKRAYDRLFGDLLTEAAAALRTSNSPRAATYIAGYGILQKVLCFMTGARG